MSEFQDIMQLERARTGNYGNDYYDGESDTICDICGCMAEKFYIDRYNNIVGCENCIEMRYTNEI